VIGLLGAVQFLTRVPVHTDEAVAHERCVPWFPIVGVLLGGLVGGLAVGLGELVPVSVAAACAVVGGLLVTGAFHEDGLADVADAFGGGTTRERRLEILADPRHGTYGVAALAGSVLVRVVAAASIVSSAALFAGFVAAHALGRAAAVAVMGLAPTASDTGLGATYASRLRALPTVAGIGAAVIVSGLLVGWWIGAIVAIAAAGAGLTVLLAIRKIGGIVGDVLGAVEQVVECLVLITVSGLAAHHQLWWA
jgi:adenosylcobinamide-GDP ribazoletransferase